MHRKFWLFLAVTGLVVSCSNEQEQASTGANEIAAAYASALDAAELAKEKAKRSESEWTGAHALMENAAQLAADGKLEEAVELLDEARLQFELAVAQKQREARDWQQRVIR